MTTDQTIWTVLIAAQAVVNLPFAFYLLKGTSMSDAFKAALANLVAVYTAKLNDLQSQLEAANTAGAEAGAKTDAEATAEVIAATPQ